MYILKACVRQNFSPSVIAGGWENFEKLISGGDVYGGPSQPIKKIK